MHGRRHELHNDDRGPTRWWSRQKFASLQIQLTMFRHPFWYKTLLETEQLMKSTQPEVRALIPQVQGDIAATAFSSVLSVHVLPRDHSVVFVGLKPG